MTTRREYRNFGKELKRNNPALFASKSSSGAGIILDPTRGSIVVGDSGDQWNKLGIGTIGQVLTVSAGGQDPEWQTRYPKVVGTYSHTNTSADISRTAILASAPAGTYRSSVYAESFGGSGDIIGIHIVIGFHSSRSGATDVLTMPILSTVVNVTATTVWDLGDEPDDSASCIIKHDGTGDISVYTDSWAGFSDRYDLTVILERLA